jgi:hypothetical protein
MLSGGAIICDSCGTTVIPPAMLGGAHICERCRARHEAYYDRLRQLVGDLARPRNGGPLREREPGHRRHDRAELSLPSNNYASPHSG